jgi:hypothetical protein
VGGTQGKPEGGVSVMTVVDAPLDLIPLIEAYTDAFAEYDTGARVKATYDLIFWPHWKKRTRYVHGDIGVSMIWGSLKVTEKRDGEWRLVMCISPRSRT